MENASKALIIASSVLLGVMILSIGVYLFSTYAQYSSDTYAKIEKTQITEFNAQFLKYYGSTVYSYVDATGAQREKEDVIKCTAHDIITVANLAQQNNQHYQIDNLSGYDTNTYYIQVDLGNSTKNIEKWNNENKIKFIKDNSNEKIDVTQPDGSTEKIEQTKYYKMKKYEVSEITKRVNYIQFIEL